MERNESFYKSIVNKLHSAFAYYKIITDSKGKPIDYEFIEVNQAFEEMTRLKSKDIIGKSAVNILPDIIKEKEKWIEYYGEVALKRLKKEYEHFSESLNKCYQVNVYSPEQGYFVTIFNEITIYKHIEDKIEESENKYRRLVDSANEGIVTLNENNTVTFANRQMCTMLGYKWEEVRGKKEDYFMFMEDMPDYIKKTNERKHGKSQIYERRLKHKDGSAIWALISATPIFNKNNAYKGSYKLFTDITDRIRMEKQIKTSELKFHSYFEKSPYAIFIFDSEARYIEVNHAACVLYEYTQEEFKQLNVLNLLVPECIEPGLKYFNKLINTGSACIELLTVSKNGNKYVALLDSVKISDDEYICYSRNISEKKAREELEESIKLIRKAHKMTNIGTWTYTIKTGKVKWSDELFDLLGINKTDGEPGYKEHSKFFNSQEWVIFDNAVDLAINEEIPYTLKLNFIKPDGNEIPLIIKGDIDKNSDGKVIRLFGTVQNITDMDIVKTEN